MDVRTINNNSWWAPILFALSSTHLCTLAEESQLRPKFGIRNRPAAFPDVPTAILEGDAAKCGDTAGRTVLRFDGVKADKSFIRLSSGVVSYCPGREGEGEGEGEADRWLVSSDQEDVVGFTVWLRETQACGPGSGAPCGVKVCTVPRISALSRCRCRGWPKTCVVSEIQYITPKGEAKFVQCQLYNADQAPNSSPTFTLKRTANDFLLPCSGAVDGIRITCGLPEFNRVGAKEYADGSDHMQKACAPPPPGAGLVAAARGSSGCSNKDMVNVVFEGFDGRAVPPEHALLKKGRVRRCGVVWQIEPRDLWDVEFEIGLTDKGKGEGGKRETKTVSLLWGGEGSSAHQGQVCTVQC